MKIQIPGEKHRYFYKRTKILRKMGVWPVSNVQKSDNNYKFYVAFVLLSILTILSFMFIAMVKFVLEQKEFNEAVCARIISFFRTGQMIVKMVMTIFQAKHIQKLIDDLSITMRKNFVTKEEDFEILKKCRKSDHKMSKFFCVMNALVFIVVLIKPLPPIFKRMLKSHEFNTTETDVLGELPIEYPFPIYEKSFWYPTIYATQVVLGMGGLSACWVMDSTLCSLLNYLCGHFDILANNIKNYQSQNDADDKKMAKKFVEHHSYLLNYGKEFNRAFAPFIIMQFGLGAFVIGMQLIHFILLQMKSGSTLAFGKPINYLVLKFFQLYIFSWHGQLLWDKSVYIADACYNSLWTTKSKSWCMGLKTMMVRSHRPMKVEIASLFQLSMEAFQNLLNTAYSMFTMMQTVIHN